MYEQIGSNVRRSVGLISLFILIIIGLGYLFSRVTGYPEMLPFAVIFAVLGSIASYFKGDQIVLAMSHARPVTKDEYPHLYNSVEGLAMAAGLPMPAIYVIDDSAPNAFATGRNPQHASIAVTTGLLDKMNRVELEGVIAHEMSHIKGYDIRLMMLAAIMVGTIVLIADWMRTSMWWGSGRRRNRDGDGSPIILVVALLAAVIAPIAATLIQLALSRRREFLADAQGALLTRYPDGLASALEKLEADTEPLEVANKATAHMYIVNPLKNIQGALNNLFSTHPPLEERIRRLREM